MMYIVFDPSFFQCYNKSLLKYKNLFAEFWELKPKYMGNSPFKAKLVAILLKVASLVMWTTFIPAGES